MVQRVDDVNARLHTRNETDHQSYPILQAVMEADLAGASRFCSGVAPLRPPLQEEQRESTIIYYGWMDEEASA